MYNWWLEEGIDYGNGGWDKSVYKNTQMVTIAYLFQLYLLKNNKKILKQNLLLMIKKAYFCEVVSP